MGEPIASFKPGGKVKYINPGHGLEGVIGQVTKIVGGAIFWLPDDSEKQNKLYSGGVYSSSSSELQWIGEEEKEEEEAPEEELDQGDDETKFSKGDEVLITEDVFVSIDGKEVNLKGQKGLLVEVEHDHPAMFVPHEATLKNSYDNNGSWKIFQDRFEIVEPTKTSVKETRKMANKMESTTSMLKERMTHGIKVAAADEAGNLMLSVIEVALGDAYPDLAKTDQGKALLKMMAALGLHYMCSSMPDMVPAPEAIQQACGLVIDGVTRDQIQPMLAAIGPKLGELAKIGKAAAKGQIRIDTETGLEADNKQESEAEIEDELNELKQKTA